MLQRVAAKRPASTGFSSVDGADMILALAGSPALVSDRYKNSGMQAQLDWHHFRRAHLRFEKPSRPAANNEMDEGSGTAARITGEPIPVTPVFGLPICLATPSSCHNAE